MRFPWRRARVLSRKRVVCPDCAADLATEQIPDGSQATIRCSECGCWLEIYPDMTVEKRGIQ